MKVDSRAAGMGVCVGLMLLLGIEFSESGLAAPPRRTTLGTAAGSGGDHASGSGDSRSTLHTDEAESAFTTVEIQGNANLSAGNIAGAGPGDANSSIGVYGETDAGFSIIAAFSFGSKGTSITATSLRDYAAFLEQPTSTLGGQVKLQWSWNSGPWLHYGLTVNSRVFSVDMSFGDDGASQRINLVAIDPSVSLSALLDRRRKLSVVAELGIATRVWNKPGAAFRDDLNLTEAHAFAGPRVAAAISIGDIYAGVEMMRYFGGPGLEPLREFAIVPYVGIRGSLDLSPSKEGKEKSSPILQLN